MPPIIGLLLQYAPDLIGLFAGDKATSAAGKVADVAKVVFGTDDARTAQARIAIDPRLAEAFVEQARQATEQFRLEIGDVQNARQQTVALVERGSAIAWAPVLISALIVAGFLTLTVSLLYKALPDSQVAMVLFGALSAGFTQVINYWLGSSAGSKRSGDVVRSLAEATLTPRKPIASKP